MNQSPGAAGRAVVNEIASWSDEELDAKIAAAFAKCPATGRSASACSDQSHAACYQGAAESVRLDRKVESEHRRQDGSY